MPPPPVNKSKMYGIVVEGFDTANVSDVTIRNVDGPAIGISKDHKRINVENIDIRNSGGIEIMDSSPFREATKEVSANRVSETAKSRGWSRSLEENWPFTPTRSTDMPKPDFSDAYEKLRRAKHHISDVETAIVNFLNTDFYRIRIERNERESRMEIVFDSLHEPSKAINALIGDAIGNLRSVLDYAVVALAYPFTGDPKKSSFPNAPHLHRF